MRFASITCCPKWEVQGSLAFKVDEPRAWKELSRKSAWMSSKSKSLFLYITKYKLRDMLSY